MSKSIGFLLKNQDHRPMERPMAEKVNSSRQRGVRFGAEWSPINRKKDSLLRTAEVITHALRPRGLAIFIF